MTLSRRLLVVGGVVTLIAGGVASAIIWTHSDHDEASAHPSIPAVSVGSIESPTLAHSATTAPGASQSPTPSSAPAVATPTVPPVSAAASPATAKPKDVVNVIVTISDWNGTNQVAEVAGYANVIEADGTCTLTMTRDKTTVTTVRSASSDASTTSCGMLSIAGSRLTAGSWNAVLSYESATSHGASTPISIEVNR